MKWICSRNRNRTGMNRLNLSEGAFFFSPYIMITIFIYLSNIILIITYLYCFFFRILFFSIFICVCVFVCVFHHFFNIYFIQIKMCNFTTQKQKIIISMYMYYNKSIKSSPSLAVSLPHSSVFGSVLLLALVCVYASFFPSTCFDVFKCLCPDL